MLIKILVAIYLIIGFLFGSIGLAGLKYSNEAKTRLAYHIWEKQASIDDKLLYYCKIMVLWLPLTIIRLVEIFVEHIMDAYASILF